ncbi:MAG TPA: hypothetical protein VHN80_28400 [Kineosporiaceae bacterium]|jgi:hypothetical protein|nr:hypothetical protein [Kineosporiaceae bacterium]
MTEPTVDEQLAREAERVADRLRVLGPRWAHRDVAGDAEQLAGVRSALQQLADLAADAGRAPRRGVPELRPHALGDQVLVLAHEAAAAGCGASARDVLVNLRHALL